MRVNPQAQNRAALPNLPDIRRIAGNMEQYFGRETGSTGVYRWVKELTEKTDSVVNPMKVATGGVCVANEVVVNVGGNKYRLFNVMDSDTRFMLAAYLSPVRTTGPRRQRWRGKPDKPTRIPAAFLDAGVD